MRRRIVILAAALLPAGQVACQGPLEPVFPVVDPPVVWPRPPDQPRIRYIGALTGEASLRARPGGWEALGAVFSGPRPRTAFSTPTAVAVAGETVFVADAQGRAVYRLDLENRKFLAITHAAGRPFEWPIDLLVADGHLLVADSQQAAVFVLDLDGRHVRSIGEGVLKRPSSLARTETGRLWVVDSAEHDCKVFDVEGRLVRRIGRRGAGKGEFNYPAGVAFRDGAAVIADAMNFRVQLLAADGRVTGAFGRKGDAAGDFAMPRDAAVDSEGHVYVLDNQFENVQVFDRLGRLLMAFGQEGRGPGEFYLPSGITIDARDRIWVADTYNRRVQVFQYLSGSREPGSNGLPEAKADATND